MRGKRSKQYRKLMQQYQLHFGFREPYQVIVDADVLLDAARFKMDFAGMLEKTLHGQVKLMITQCSMRHLYNAEPKNETVVTHAKDFERRRCNHHELDQPLSTLECLQSVVDPKDNKTNKHRYVVATQDADVRMYLRTIPGVPLVYLKRSVMIMEPMAGSTEQVRDREERDKLRAGLKPRTSGRGVKRARESDEDDALGDGNVIAPAESDSKQEPPKKKTRGPKGPNPLSVKKKTKTESQSQSKRSVAKNTSAGEDAGKTKRRRRHNKTGKENDGGEETPA